MPLWLLPGIAKYGWVIALTTGLLVTGLMWDRSRINRAEERGARNEKVRVEETGKKIGKKASAAAAAAERDPRRVLSVWQRD